MTSRTRLPALLVLLTLGLTACSSVADLGAADGEAAGGSAAAEEALDADTLTGARGADEASTAALDTTPAVIQVGTLTLRSDDVAEARVGVEKVADAHGGRIADERTMATAEGGVHTSKVVLRVPAADFDDAMRALAALGEVTESTRRAEDVTGEVVDTRARVRAQEQSLQRVEVLFRRAQDIRDIVAIEAQLSRRQADLDALKARLAWLQDQTSLSTITVYLEHRGDGAPTDGPDDVAFVAGVKAGWHALAALGGGVATVTGAVLPFAVLALLLGVPAAVVVRRRLAARPPSQPATEA